jgi:hypothetical protein
MNVIQTARRILKLTEREVKALERKKSKARDAWLKAMHLAEAKASVLNGIENQLSVAQEKLEDYTEEVKYYDKHGVRPATRKKATKKVAKKTSKKKATKKVAKKNTKRS